MKKSFIALAAVAAIVGTAGTAAAQTNITIYGVADAAVSRFDNGTSSATRLDSGAQSGSRIGFKGTEDLGGGLSAIFTLENGFNIDDGTLGQNGRLFGRQAFVGLSSSSVGALKFGRQYNPIRPAVEVIDPFGLGLAGNAANVFNVYGDRTDNTLNFTTANFGGFTGQLAYSLGEIVGSNSIGRSIGASAGYAAGPLNVILAHHKQNLVAAGVDNGNSKTSYLGATYDFSVVKVHAAFATNKGETAAGVTNIDRDEKMIGVTVPVGAFNVLASWIRRSDDTGADRDADQLALGLTYDLSKRTNLYTSYARTKNEANASLNGAAAAGRDPSLFNVGIRHKF